MSPKIAFTALLGVNFFILLALICGLSISYHEATIVYGESSFLKFYISLSLNLFGFNDYALRLPMVVLHLYSAWLLYLISNYYLTRPWDKLWLLAIYLLLPGVTSAALLVNVAGLKIAMLFSFIYSYLRWNSKAFVLLPLFFLLDSSVIFFYLSIAVFGYLRQNYRVMILSSLLFIGSIIYFDPGIGGIPEGRFLDALGIYAAIFSPLVFVYLFYVLYRRFITDERDLLWMIASSFFIISLLLSFRQKVNIQDFAPYMMVALPLAAQTFSHTYRVRLSMFRRRYRILFYSTFGLLVLNALVVLFNQWLYHWIEKPKKHFSYPMHVAKELAHTLHNNDIHCVKADEEMQLRLKFYGIPECSSNILKNEQRKNGKKVTISYIGIPIYTTYVTKINK